MLKITNLNIKTEEKEILKDFNLEIGDGEIHILMGPNGAGKSTVCKSLLNHPSYQKTSGSIFFDDIDITNRTTSEIAKQGIYYIIQNPIEIEGITNAEMLRNAMQSHGIKMNIFEFNKKCTEICEKLSLPKSFLYREVNVGMSGGERKKNELLHMWLLEPKLILLDEIDSGLDVDALKIVGKSLKEYQSLKNASILVITHQEKLIDILKPNYVHIIKDGTIIKNGDFTLAKNILKQGFTGANKVDDEEKNE